MPRRLLALLGPLIVLLAAGHCDAGFTITDLGALGDSSGGLGGINSRGIVAGTAYGPNGPVAVVSTPTGALLPVDLRGLAAGPSYATGISDDGAVVGTYYNTADRAYHGFQFVAGKATDLGLTTRMNSYGVAINASGAVAATVYSADGTTSPVRIQGTTAAIALPGGSTGGRATGIGNGGALVGSYTDAKGTSHVFTASSNQAVDPLRGVATPGFSSNMYGAAINAAGQVTGYGDFNGQKRAFFLSGSTFYDLRPADGFTSTRSIAMNDAGLVVGQMDRSGALSHAFLWAPPDESGSLGGMLDLNSLLSAADQSMWTLTSATGINASNQISGQGYVNGVLHGFVLTPVPGSVFTPAAVPAPPSAALALGGLAMAGGWARLRRGRIGARGTA